MADIDSLQELRKLQLEFTDRLEQELKLVRASKSGAGDVSLQKKTEGAEKAQAALDASIKERDAIVKFWDERVERLRAEVASRANEVRQLKKQIAEAKRRPTPPAQKKRK
jgi:chromosome segregation ATPase